MRFIYPQDQRKTPNQVSNKRHNPVIQHLTRCYPPTNVSHNNQAITSKEFRTSYNNQHKSKREQSARNKRSKPKMQCGIAGCQGGKLGAKTDINTSEDTKHKCLRKS